MGSPTYVKDKEEAIAVIKRLKETGWTFASHGYAHLNAASISFDKFVSDTKQWIAEVEPLIGHTALYVYPFGSSVPTGSTKFKYLMDSGFQVMFSVGPLPYLNIMDNSITMDRRHIDGIALHSQRAKLFGLFDTNKIIDSIRPNQY
jgi:peptidoglycan/xylan/chitin deacetylase (PgdA/CDA1 family)